jgi:hypothetical protein
MLPAGRLLDTPKYICCCCLVWVEHAASIRAFRILAMDFRMDIRCLNYEPRHVPGCVLQVACSRACKDWGQGAGEAEAAKTHGFVGIHREGF